MGGVCSPYIAQGNVFNKLRIEVASLFDVFQQAVDHVVKIGVLHATLATFCERGSDSERDDYIVGVLLCAAISS